MQKNHKEVTGRFQTSHRARILQISIENLDPTFTFNHTEMPSHKWVEEMFCFYFCIILGSHNLCCDCTISGYSCHWGWLLLFSIISSLKQACNGTLQNQRERWNEQALLPSANMPESGVPYSMLNQNQHKKAKYTLEVICCQMYCLLFKGLGFMVFWLKEPEQMGNTKQDERCLKSDLI